MLAHRWAGVLAHTHTLFFFRSSKGVAGDGRASHVDKLSPVKNMASNSQQPKVDQTVVYPSNSRSCLFITHIDIPHVEGQDQNEVLQRIVPFLENEYGNQVFTFQVTATYVLRNPATGATRTWTGSFSPRGNEHGILQEFQQFERHSFTRSLLGVVSSSIPQLQALLNVPETSWIVENVRSVIVNCQALVPTTFPTLTLRQLTTPRSNRHVRRHITYPLP